MSKFNEKYKGLLIGLAVGDALGVHFEFSIPKELENESFEFMKGFGTQKELF